MKESDKDAFSSEFYKANSKIEMHRKSYANAKTDAEKNRIEFVALLENNMDLFKHELSHHSNYTKKEELFKYINKNFYKINDDLKDDKQINNYLFKNGFFSESTYIIIEILIIAILSTILFLIVDLFTTIGLSSFSAFVWLLLSIVVLFLFDTTTYTNFYRVKK